jgi:signal transduction histidine kinase
VTDTGIALTEDQDVPALLGVRAGGGDHGALLGGTGLGLALSRRLCRLKGGDISVTVEHGRGRTFTIRLPAQVQAAVAEP